MNHEDSLQTLNDLLRCCGTHDLNFVLAICWSSQPRLTRSHLTAKDLINPGPSLAMDLVVRGLTWLAQDEQDCLLLTSWHPKHLSKYPRVSALDNLLFSALNALLCSSPNVKQTPFFVNLHEGSAEEASNFGGSLWLSCPNNTFHFLFSWSSVLVC